MSPRVTDFAIDGPHGRLPLRTYTPTAAGAAGLVWVHGGGFAHGSIDMPEADATARAFAEAGVTVVSVDYRLAPERAEWIADGRAEPRDGVRFPVPSDEVTAAFRWARGADLAPGPWSIGGASAGANLAAAACLNLADTPPAHALLAYPTLHATQEAPDAALRARLDARPEADVFGPASVWAMYANYIGADPADASDVALPGTASVDRLRAFPPTTIVLSESDELRMSGIAFARSLMLAGVPVTVETEPGTTHGHLNSPGPAAAATIARFLRSM